MAKDDYHVIVFRFLSYLYECLKKGEKVDSKAFEQGGKSGRRRKGRGRARDNMSRYMNGIANIKQMNKIE